MARIQRQQRFTRQPQGTFPKLKREFADAVFVYLPSVGLAQAADQGMGVTSGALPVASQLFGSTSAVFGAADGLGSVGTAALDFSATGFTILVIGSYPATGGVKSLVNRQGASQAGGFTVALYNMFAPTPGRVYSSYNKAGVDTNYDSLWVNGAKATSGNGDPNTAINTRYVVTANAASGPGASTAPVDIQIGREPGGNDGQSAVELAIIWPRKLNETLMRQLTRDPYSVFQPPVRLSAAFVPAGGTSITPDVGALTETGFAPTIAQPRGLAPDVAALTETGYAPTLAQPRGLAPDPDALALATFAPTLAQTANVVLVPGVAALSLATFAPSLSQSSSTSLMPGVAALALATFAPTLAQPRGIAPGAAALALATYAPTLAQPRGLAPAVGALAATGYAPSINQGAGATLQPNTAALALATFAPTLAQTANVVLVPGVAALALSSFAPTVAQPRALSPSVAALVLQGFAPAILQPHGLAPAAAALTVAGRVPTLSQTQTVILTPGAAALALATYAPTLAVAGPYVWEYSERVLRMLPDNRVMTMPAASRVVQKLPEKRTIPPVPNYVRF